MRLGTTTTLFLLALSPVSDGWAQVPDAERQLWNRTLGLGTREAFGNFLDSYPTGRFASDAFRCLVELRIDPSAEGCAIEPEAGPAGPSRSEKGNFIADLR